MADPSPEIVEAKFKEGELDENAATTLLISYVENSENENDREKSIEILSQLPLHDDNHYRFIEELLISDSNIAIQGYAASILITNFLERGLESIRWVIRQKRSPSLLSKVLNSLLKTAEETLREILIEEFNTILSGQGQSVKSDFKPYMRDLISEYNEFFEVSPVESIPTKKLMEIFLNYETLVFLGVYYDVFYNLGFDLKDGYVTGLRIEGSGTANWNQPSDIDGLTNFSKLEELTLKMGNFHEIGNLEPFFNLKILEISECFITEINNLEELSDLEHLSLASNKIKEIKGLENLKKLKSLLLLDNQIKDIEGLNELVNLLGLDLGENHIEEIKGLDTLKDLELLNLEFNKIEELKGLENLRNLKILELYNNKITKIANIDNLVNLSELDLNNNQIQKIEGIETLTKLETLRLSYNQIETLEGIKNLTSLNSLSVNDNKISKVRDLKEINHYILIDLSNNNLSETLIKTIRELEKKKDLKLIYNSLPKFRSEEFSS